jgi:hypothetical protein
LIDEGFVMATDQPQSDIRDFYAFLGRRMHDNDAALTPEQSVEEFRAYQEERQRFIQETMIAVEQARQGMARPLDVDALMRRVERRLAEEGGRDGGFRTVDSEG